MKRRAAALVGICWGVVAALAAAQAAGAASAVHERALPDLDRALPAVLDLELDTLAKAPPPESFGSEAEYRAALARLGDLAYDDADGGLLFVASGLAAALGPGPPRSAALAALDQRLEERAFLRGPELDPGSWFAVRTRAGSLVLGRVASRTAGAIRLRWAPPAAPFARYTPESMEAIAADPAADIATALLPPMRKAVNSVLRLSDRRFARGPALAKSFSAEMLHQLVSGAWAAGDLAYFRPRSGMLVVASGKVAQLGTGPVSALAGRDLRGRLRERSLLAASEIPPGMVLLIETVSGQHALLRIEGVEPGGLRVTWLVQPDGSAVFPDLAAFDASFEIPDPAELNRRLLAAAARGDPAGLRRLIELGANPNTSVGRGGRPALVHAVIAGDAGTVDLLLEAGADPQGQGAGGWNALNVAARLGRAELAETLISAGADPQMRTPKGKDALQLALESSRRAPSLIHSLRQAAGTPDTLESAARVGDVAVLTSLLRFGSADDADEALHIAAASGQPAALRALLEAGADPNLECEQHGSALLAAARGGRVQSVALLLEHGGIAPTHKASALYAANERNDPELARLLLRGGANAELRAGQPLAPLAHARRYGSDALLDVYLEMGHALTAPTAARLGRLEELTALLSDGADARLLLRDAIENDQLEVLRALLDHGVDPGLPLPTWDRRSPLHEAARLANVELAALLLDRGADPNAIDRVGRSPLYDAITFGREQTARLLLERGADPNLAPPGEALLDVMRQPSFRELLQGYGARPGPGGRQP